MDFLPFDMTNVQPKGGFKPYPEGFYLLQVTKTDELRMVKDGSHERRTYQSEIIMGPGWSEEFKGKSFYERLSMQPEEAGRHMDLFAACFGSVEAVKQLAAQNQGRLAPAMVETRYYVVQVSINGTFNNVMQRLPYTEQGWNEAVGGHPGASVMTSAIPGAAPMAAAPAPMTAPMAAPAPAPMMAPAPAPMAAPAPVAAPMAAPMMPAPMPAPMAAPVATPMAAPAVAPAVAPGLPAPPPPPGTVAGS